MASWPRATVSAIASSARNALVGGPFGSNLVARDYVPQGVPVIRGQNMGERWVSGEFVYVSESKAESLSANLARPGDVVFTQRGTLGQVSLVPPQPFDRYLLSQSQMKVTPNRQLADPSFLYYVFRSPEQRDYVTQRVIQTGVPHTNLGILRETCIPLPPWPEQCAIAHILGSLDDKIELNRRMNETLEEIARTLFKSWFVDFDPVRAKAEGRDTGLPSHIADLFPDSFEESELGEIPAGWPTPELSLALDEVNDRVGAGDVPEYSSTNEGLQPRSEIFNKKLAASSSKNKVVRKGYLVFGLSRRVLNFGLMKAPVGSVSGAYKVFRVDADIVAPELLEQTIRARPAYYYNALSASSREGQSLSADGLRRLRFVQFPVSLQTALAEVVEPLTARNESLRAEITTLAAIRDALLPKLISGELRVPDAEKLVEAAV